MADTIRRPSRSSIEVDENEAHQAMGKRMTRSERNWLLKVRSITTAISMRCRGITKNKEYVTIEGAFNDRMKRNDYYTIWRAGTAPRRMCSTNRSKSPQTWKFVEFMLSSKWWIIAYECNCRKSFSRRIFGALWFILPTSASSIKYKTCPCCCSANIPCAYQPFKQLSIKCPFYFQLAWPSSFTQTTSQQFRMRPQTQNVAVV